MLGSELGTLRGKVTGQRVLPAEGPSPRMEVSFELSGTLLGKKVTMLGTYWSQVRPDGSLYGECPRQGVLMTPAGEMGTWTGAGVGQFTGKGSAVSYRGAVYFTVGGKSLARLGKMAVVYEWEIDEQGNGEARFTEWK
jgi:hypothetical protein